MYKYLNAGFIILESSEICVDINLIKIDNAVHKSLRKRVSLGEIKAYIPGEAFSSLVGYDEIIHQNKELINNDSDYKRGNDGITYIIL